MEGLTFLNIKIRYTHRTWFLNTVHQWKELGLLGEMIDPTTGTKEIKDEPGASCCARKWGSTQIRKEKKKKDGGNTTDMMCPQCITQKTWYWFISLKILTTWSQPERLPKVQSWKTL